MRLSVWHSHNLKWLAPGAVLLAIWFPAEAQQPKKVPRIGFLGQASASFYSTAIEAFRDGLHGLGYVEGKNILIEYRYGEGKLDPLPELAAELIRLKVDVIVTPGGPTTLAAKKVTGTIPIVMAGVGDPLGEGLVASLARPEGNVTGVSALSPELSGKRLEILRQAFPNVSRVAVLFHGANPTNLAALKETEAAAAALQVQLQPLDVRGPDDFEPAFADAAGRHANALVVLRNAFYQAHLTQIVTLAAKGRLPAMYPLIEYVNAGGLMSYGVNTADLFRRAATHVDKILKGAKPGDLPVEQPVKFEFIINLKTAKQIGVTIPQSVLYQADKVIK